MGGVIFMLGFLSGCFTGIVLMCLLFVSRGENDEN